MYDLKSSKAVYKSDWMVVYEDSLVDNEKGIEGMFNRITVNDAVIILPIFEDSSILMLVNYRHGAGTNLLELPGGLVQANENPSDTARRELLEETGYVCDTLEYINFFYTWPARASQKNFVFVAKGLKRADNKFNEKQATVKQTQNQSEHFEYIGASMVISKQQIVQGLKNGTITSAITTSALLYGYFV
jgi:ADP-ribose pyrophosphatase